MEEKYMVNDVLNTTKNTLKMYEDVIETCQYDLFRLANMKGYYTPAAQATQNEINQVKNQMQQG